jgi:hypothetical protein
MTLTLKGREFEKSLHKRFLGNILGLGQVPEEVVQRVHQSILILQDQMAKRLPVSGSRRTD